MKISRTIILLASLFSALLLISAPIKAQDTKKDVKKLIVGTWNLDSLEINSDLLPEAMVKIIYSKMQENKKHTTYFYGEDGKYINYSIEKSVEGNWELSETGDTLILMLQGKNIFNKIHQIDENRFIIEPLGETKGTENGKIYMIKPEE